MKMYVDDVDYYYLCFKFQFDVVFMLYHIIILFSTVKPYNLLTKKLKKKRKNKKVRK